MRKQRRSATCCNGQEPIWGLTDAKHRSCEIAPAYFIVVGPIEPRKNLLLLFNVWRELVRRQGELAPHLVIIGSLGWGHEPVLRALRNSPLLQNRVIFARGLSSSALRRLVAHARALLVPSFVEGF